MAAQPSVRVEESLRVKIGEAKNLATGGVSRDTICKVRFDQEEIFATSVVEKSHNPFFGEEFHCEIPIRFRFLSFYICDKTNNREKVLGKVCLKKEELSKYRGKDHWFPLKAVHAESEVQGKVQIEVAVNGAQDGGSPNAQKHHITVRIPKCENLLLSHGQCNPYAEVVLLAKGDRQSKVIKRTVVRKKTFNPSFTETFVFDVEKKGQNHDRNKLTREQLGNIELCVSMWHDDSLVTRGKTGVFLGEVRIPLKDLNPATQHTAWYFLQPRAGGRKADDSNLGTLRLKISYTAHHIFSSNYYDDLRDLLLKSPNVKPVTSSAAYIFGEITDVKEDATQPLVRLFHDRAQIVQLIGALADYELYQTTDVNTIFRGNTLVSKCIDELMKLVGHHYLQDTLKDILDQIFSERKSTEIDPTRLKDGETVTANMENLEGYVQKIFEAIVYSGLNCPITMCEVFYALKEAALNHFPETKEVRYQVVSGFVFLRFFAPAILGPRLFQLRQDMPDPVVNRTLTLISKTIQSLGNIVSTKTHAFGFKEEYMIPLFKKFTDLKHIDAIKNFLDIISSLTRMHSTNIEAPVVLKEGYLIKRAQGRRKFGLKNFKRRYFCLTNHSLIYAKGEGSPALCEIPIQDILAVEELREDTFTRKYMFQVIQPMRALYIQANNCVEEKEWKHILNKVCNMNRNRLKVYHPGAYLKGHWLCCKAVEPAAEGCMPVSGELPADINMDIDSDREVERIHFIFRNNLDKLHALQEKNFKKLGKNLIGSQDVLSGETTYISVSSPDDDVKTNYETVRRIHQCVQILENAHKQHAQDSEGQIVIGSQEFPFGDDGYARYHATRL